MVILMYHGVMNINGDSEISNYSGMQLSVEKFEKQIRFLKEKYDLILLKDWLKRREPIKQKKCGLAVLTFDDGYENNYTEAFPVLKKYEAPATVFLATKHIGSKLLFWPDRLEMLFLSKDTSLNIASKVEWLHSDMNNTAQYEALVEYCKTVSESEKIAFIDELENEFGSSSTDFQINYRPLTWDQVVEMHRSGFVDFGSHTNSHVIMTRVSHDQGRKEIVESKLLLKENLDVDIDLFSYPNGGAGDFSEETHDILRQEGFKCGLLTVGGFNNRNSNVFELKRIGIHQNMSMIEFESLVSGFYMFVKKIFL